MQKYAGSFFFCLKCYKQLKQFYKFASHCMKTKNILKSYITDLITNCDENLGLFNVAVSVENIDPDNKISDTVHANPRTYIPRETTLKIVNIRSIPRIVNSPKLIDTNMTYSPKVVDTNVRNSPKYTNCEEISLDKSLFKKMGTNFENVTTSTPQSNMDLGASFNIRHLIENGDISLSVLNGDKSNISNTVVKQEVLDIEEENETYEENQESRVDLGFQDSGVPIQNAEGFNYGIVDPSKYNLKTFMLAAHSFSSKY